MAFWYGLRVIAQGQLGHWVASREYKDKSAAMSAYERRKTESDVQVSPPFEAESKADAERILTEREGGPTTRD